MYLQLTRFFIPLVLAMIAPDLGRQVLNSGMARMPQATETLAGYAVAWGITFFLLSALVQTRQLSLVLADSLAALKTVRKCVFAISLVLMGVMCILALTPVGVWVIEDLHGIDVSLGMAVREALFWLIPIPLLDGLLRFSSGLLIRIR